MAGPSGASASRSPRDRRRVFHAPPDTRGFTITVSVPRRSKAASTSAPDAVLDFMQQQNRPRNAQDVSDHFKGALSKSQAEKHLEALSEAGSVRMKLNGKAKVFWYNQELVPELSAAENDVVCFNDRAGSPKAHEKGAATLRAMLRGRMGSYK